MTWTINESIMQFESYVGFEKAHLYVTKENCLSYLHNSCVINHLWLIVPLLIIGMVEFFGNKENKTHQIIKRLAIVGGVIYWSILLIL